MISLKEVEGIHEILIDKFGGSTGIRDWGALESAINRPYQTFDQKELYPNSVDKAAAIFESLISNHPFIDGNKRTAYDEYQLGNKSTAKARIRLYEKTAISYSHMTPAIADSLANKYFINRMEQEKNLEIYYKKIKTATNALIAFEFYQAEVYLLTQIRATIMQQIPTYGQLLDAAKKK